MLESAQRDVAERIQKIENEMLNYFDTRKSANEKLKNTERFFGRNLVDIRDKMDYTKMQKGRC